MSLPILTTARLRLRPRTLADLDANVAMDLDPEVGRYIFLRGAPDPTRRRAELRDRIESGWPPVGGIWTVEPLAEPRFLGWCGLFPLEASGFVEIGYRYTRAAWGAGIATEAGRAVLAHGFRVLALDPIVAVTHPDNTASRRVLEKIGLRYEGPAHHYGLDLAFFRLNGADYRGEAMASR